MNEDVAFSFNGGAIVGLNLKTVPYYGVSQG